MKKIISVLVVLCMMIGIISVLPMQASAAATVTITSVDDWMNQLSGKSAKNCNINVTADVLDFEGKTVKPVKDFNGTFDGNGVVIKNLIIDNTGDEVGLFKCTTGPTTFKNFSIVASTFIGKEWCGAVACCTSGDVTAQNIYVGEDVTIKASKQGNNSYAGGLFGGFAGTTANVTIDSCVFAGTVTAEGQYNGGFVGNTHKATNVTITNSLMLGKVPAERNSSRGFIGNSAADEDTITMTNCIYAGGVATVDYKDHPFFNYVATANVTNCYTISAKADGTVYNSVKYTDENSGVSLITVMDIVGKNSAVTVDGFTKRANDIMMPTALVAALGDAIPSTSEKYVSKYTVTWKNDDGTVLATEEYKMGETPSYKGETPTKADDDTYTYTFSKWSPAIAPVMSDTTYTADFYSTRKNLDMGEDNEAEDNFDTKAPETKAPATDTAAADTAAEKKSGCGGIIGGSAVALVAVLGIGVVSFKKKED